MLVRQTYSASTCHAEIFDALIHVHIIHTLGVLGLLISSQWVLVHWTRHTLHLNTLRLADECVPALRLSYATYFIHILHDLGSFLYDRLNDEDYQVRPNRH